jgi:putative colanic acid biosynthesis acetyltransferase WcaF
MTSKFQDLSQFQMPPKFRGRPAWLVQFWWLIQDTLFGMSPQFLYSWRRFLLRLFGASIGKKVLIRPTVRITYPWKVTIGDYAWIGDKVELYSLGEIHIGAHSVISQCCYICTGSHDYASLAFDIYEKPVNIGEQAWIASDVFIAPGVTIGSGTVVGIRSTVLHDLPPGMICFGNPARVIKPRIMHGNNV